MHEYFGCLCTLMLFLCKKWGNVGIVRKQDVDKTSGTTGKQQYFSIKGTVRSIAELEWRVSV
jgi:hypothetical protein